jgi:hypothetical protein
MFTLREQGGYLEMQREDRWRLLDFHALVRFLQAAASVAEKFVVFVEGLDAAEVAQTARDGAVLLNFQRQVQEGFVAAGVPYVCVFDEMVQVRTSISTSVSSQTALAPCCSTEMHLLIKLEFSYICVYML